MASRPEAPASQPWEPLARPDIEPVPNRVIQADDCVVAIELPQRQQRDYVDIVRKIGAGDELIPDDRKSATADVLLRTRQALHLHLGGPGSDAILYLVQYPRHVLLVRIDTQIHLDDLPPGKRVMRMGRHAFETTLRRDSAAQWAQLAASTSRLLATPDKPKE